MTRQQASSERLLQRIHEAIVVGIIAILIGTAVYAALGFAWTFKAAFEATQKLRHPFGSH
jgi:hypothetical protein